MCGSSWSGHSQLLGSPLTCSVFVGILPCLCPTYWNGIVRPVTDALDLSSGGSHLLEVNWYQDAARPLISFQLQITAALGFQFSIIRLLEGFHVTLVETRSLLADHPSWRWCFPRVTDWNLTVRYIQHRRSPSTRLLPWQKLSTRGIHIPGYFSFFSGSSFPCYVLEKTYIRSSDGWGTATLTLPQIYLKRYHDCVSITRGASMLKIRPSAKRRFCHFLLISHL